MGWTLPQAPAGTHPNCTCILDFGLPEPSKHRVLLFRGHPACVICGGSPRRSMQEESRRTRRGISTQPLAASVFWWHCRPCQAPGCLGESSTELSLRYPLARGWRELNVLQMPLDPEMQALAKWLCLDTWISQCTEVPSF